MRSEEADEFFFLGGGVRRGEKGQWEVVWWTQRYQIFAQKAKDKRCELFLAVEDRRLQGRKR